MLVACLLIVLRKTHKQVRTFGDTTRDLVGLREWLLSEGCTHAAMESTRGVLEADLRHARRRLRGRRRQRTTRQEGSRAQDRRNSMGST